MSDIPHWPELPLAAWSETCESLHLWTQIVGKVRIACTPLINHWWNATLLVTGRGLAAPAMSYPGGSFDTVFDFANHQLVIVTSEGRTESLALKPMTVADFYSDFMEKLHRLGIDVHIWTMPGEIANAIPFDQDRTHTQYDPVYVQKFWRVLLQANRVMNEFRARFVGKASPAHFFWGSFDLAVTRFSGRTAPAFTAQVPGVASAVMREAYSHEVSSAGFWPGGNGIDYPAYYSYAYPPPPHYSEFIVQPAAAAFNDTLGEFLLPYDTVRQAADPDGTLLAFLQSTYEAAATAAQWDRAAL